MASSLRVKAPELLGITQDDWNLLFSCRSEGPNPLQSFLFAALAYAEPANVQEFLASVPHSNLEFVDFLRDDEPSASQDRLSHCHAMIFKSSDTLILSFRGTELPAVQWPAPISFALDPKLALNTLVDNSGSWLKSLQQWITNFCMDLTPFPHGGRVHLGFYTGASRLVAQFKSILSEQSSISKLFITGHSQGAALALVAAVILHFDGISIDEVRAFAPPFVGDTDFVRLVNMPLEHKIFRYTNSLDPITVCPPFSVYAPGPGTHIHLRDDKDIYATRPYLEFSMAALWQNFQLATASWLDPRNIIYHFPAGPELVIGDPHSRPGYLPPLLKLEIDNDNKQDVVTFSQTKAAPSSSEE